MNPLIDALGEDYFLEKPLDNFNGWGYNSWAYPITFILMSCGTARMCWRKKNLSVPKNWE